VNELRRRLAGAGLLKGGWSARGPAPEASDGCASSAGSRPVWISRWGRDRGNPHEPLGRARVLGLMVWGLFIVVPVLTAITNTGSAGEHVLAIAGAVAFSGFYVRLVMTWFEEKAYWRSVALVGMMLVLAVALTIADRPSWGFLFTYCAACVGLAVPSDLGMPAVIFCAGVAFGATVVAGGGSGSGVGFAASAVGIGLLLVLMRDLRMRNQELLEARAELALSAVAAERERFARDLHDLLGHSLSVIAIKAELAGRLMKLDPERASAEVADVENVARESLREVRQAVSGYRQPTLDKELEGARVALSAAGIEAEVERAPVTLDPEVEAVLAWTVREGATNVIRHSGATRCRVRVRADLVDAAVEVVDDGEGPASLSGEEEVLYAGHGITGLSERAERLRGRIEAGGLPDGRGFRLAVSVPVSATAGS
jgi:two-component system, NarL family, sensor histidine kinase DesK